MTTVINTATIGKKQHSYERQAHEITESMNGRLNLRGAHRVKELLGKGGKRSDFINHIIKVGCEHVSLFLDNP